MEECDDVFSRVVVILVCVAMGVAIFCICIKAFFCFIVENRKKGFVWWCKEISSQALSLLNFGALLMISALAACALRFFIKYLL